MNDEPNCWTCAYRDLPETAEPCASCDMYFSHFESSEPTESTDTAASEDARRCSLCKFRDTLLVQSPCQKCALTPGLPSFTSDTNKLVEMEMMKREEAKRREAKMAGPTCLTCKHKGYLSKRNPASPATAIRIIPQMNLRHVPKVRTRTTMSSNRAILALTGITSVAILHALIADRSGELSTRNMKKRKRMKRMSSPLLHMQVRGLARNRGTLCFLFR